MEKNASPVTVAVTFKAADGSTVAAPAGVTFTSSTPGVDNFSFVSTPNADGSYNLVVAPVADGSDTISVEGLSGSLGVSVTEPAAVAVEFSPTSI